MGGEAPGIEDQSGGSAALTWRSILLGDVGPGSPIMAHQAMGAMLVFVLGSLYYSRHHLKKAALCAIGKGHESYDENEPCSYRLAMGVLVASVAVMALWLWKAGLPLLHSCVFVLAAIVIFFGLPRVVAQCGVLHVIYPI